LPHFTTGQTRKQGNKWHEPHHTSINKIMYLRIDYSRCIECVLVLIYIVYLWMLRNEIRFTITSLLNSIIIPRSNKLMAKSCTTIYKFNRFLVRIYSPSQYYHLDSVSIQYLHHAVVLSYHKKISYCKINTGQLKVEETPIVTSVCTLCLLNIWYNAFIETFWAY
jgi:hypothetical protein